MIRAFEAMTQCECLEMALKIRCMSILGLIGEREGAPFAFSVAAFFSFPRVFLSAAWLSASASTLIAKTYFVTTHRHRISGSSAPR